MRTRKVSIEAKGSLRVYVVNPNPSGVLMKKTAALINFLVSFLAIGLSFQAQANDEKVVQSLFCKNTRVEMNIEKYESGTVAWVVTELATGAQEEFMGFVGAETTNEFYSTDLGSDLHVKNGRASVTLTRFEATRYNLVCAKK
jgi:hypothetical protein